MEQSFLERLVLQSVCCLKKIRVFNNRLNDKPSSSLHCGSCFTLYLFFWKKIISKRLTFFRDTKCQLLKIGNFIGSETSPTYQNISNFSEMQIVSVEICKLFRIKNQVLNEVEERMHVFVLYICLSSITVLKGTDIKAMILSF